VLLTYSFKTAASSINRIRLFRFPFLNLICYEYMQMSSNQVTSQSTPNNHRDYATTPPRFQGARRIPSPDKRQLIGILTAFDLLWTCHSMIRPTLPRRSLKFNIPETNDRVWLGRLCPRGASARDTEGNSPPLLLKDRKIKISKDRKTKSSSQWVA
jgi:hypothetical protein